MYLRSIIIPTFNEEKRVSKTLEELAVALGKRKDVEVIVVDDSSDSTPEVVFSFSKKFYKLKIIHFSKRLGKGGALVKGFQAASGEVLIMDADASLDAKQALKLFDYLKKFDVVIASRYLPSSKKEITASRWFASRNFNLLVRALFGLHYSDTQCGYKAFSEKAAKAIARESIETGFAWDVEALLIARRHGLKVIEAPVSWKHVKGSVAEANILKTGSRMLSQLLALKRRF